MKVFLITFLWGCLYTDGDAKNMLMAEYSFQYAKEKKRKKEKVIWDSRLPQSIIIIVHIKISSGYTGKAFCFTGFFNDSYSWLVKPLICHRLLKDLWEETLKTLCFLYIEGIFHKIQMAENKVSWNFNKLSIERIVISLLKRKSGPGLQLEIQEEKKSCCI